MRILAILPLILGLSACDTAHFNDEQPSDYESELTELNQSIQQLREASDAETATAAEINRLIYLLYRRASLTSDFDHFKIVEAAINEALKTFGPSEQLYLFMADLNLKLHRLEEAEAALESLARLNSEHPQIEVLKADIALQRGRYEKAEKAYQAIVAKWPSWDNLSRMAYYKANTHQPAEADRIYALAADKLTAKQMQQFAWVTLQRGILNLEYRQYPQALEYYRQADQVYSGYWLIQEHIAEVLDRLGNTGDAIEVYRHVVKNTQKPEFIGALALLLDERNPEEAKRLHEKAQLQFQKQYQLYPEAALGHYVKYLLEKEPLDPKLLNYAKQNYGNRPNAESKILLAKAFLRTGNRGAATKLMEEVMQTPWWTPEIQVLAKKLGVN